MPQWIITPDKYLAPHEVKQLKKTCLDLELLGKSKGKQIQVRDANLVLIALSTGLRVAELSNLKVSHLYVGKGQSAILVKNGKGGKDRIVSISAKLKARVQAYLEYRAWDSPYLFVSKRSDKMSRSAIQKVFKKIAAKAGLPKHYSIHSLRHTYATMLYKSSGYNLRLVQKQLGHVNINTTTVYSDVVNDDLEKALDNLELEE